MEIFICNGLYHFIIGFIRTAIDQLLSLEDSFAIALCYRYFQNRIVADSGKHDTCFVLFVTQIIVLVSVCWFPNWDSDSIYSNQQSMAVAFTTF